MKSIKALFILGCLYLLGSATLYAQVPQAFSYQAVARDANGEIKANATITVQVRIIQGSESGSVLYTETHTVETSEIGSFSLEIGRGTTSDSFSGINWIDGPHFLAMGVDLNGGSTFVDVGSTKLLSVPFAIMSQSTVSGGGAFPQSVTLNSDNGDTSFRLTSEGSTRVDPLIVTAQTEGANTAISGVTVPGAGNSNEQRGVQGFVNGNGTGQHIGVLGSAYNLEGTGQTRYGVYGQAGSRGVQNIGMLGFANGAGNGDIQTDVNNSNVGTVNAGSVGFATGNENFNLGVRGRAYGSLGARENVGVQGHSEATASGRNIGVQALSTGSQSLNIGVLSSVGFTGNTQDNIGMQVFVRRGGARSIGAEIHADKAILTYGDVEVNGNISYTGSLAQTSDLRLKDNIRYLNNGLDVIMQLNPASYTYKWNSNGMGMTLSRGQHYGLIAQDVEKVLPALVQSNTHRYQVQENNPESMSPDGPEGMVTKEFEYKSLNYTELIPFLIKAVQEQQEMIESQQKEIDALKKLLEKK